MKQGDILKAVWGYDQTNVDYYEVVRVMKTMVDFRPIGQESLPDSQQDMVGKCRPKPGHYTGPARRGKVKVGREEYIQLNSYSIATVCDATQWSRWSSYA